MHLELLVAHAVVSQVLLQLLLLPLRVRKLMAYSLACSVHQLLQLDILPSVVVVFVCVVHQLLFCSASVFYDRLYGVDAI